MKAIMKTLLPVFLIVLVATGAYFILNSFKKDPGHFSKGDSNHAEAPVLGSIIKDIGLEKFGSNQTVKFSELKSKVVLINFWASWCDSCMVEMPSIQKLYETYQSQGFEVAGVNVDDDPASVVPKIVKDLKLTFPMYVDNNQNLSQYFDVVAIPFTVILDSSRKILFVESGERDWNSEDVHTQLKLWLK
jgi:thiol-disulfide isomerase/thioredoxin